MTSKEPIDGEVIEKGQEHTIRTPDDMHGILYDGIAAIPWFTAMLSVILYILLGSTIYNNNVLGRLGSQYVRDDGNKTDMGIIFTAVIFGILLATIQGLHNGGLI